MSDGRFVYDPDTHQWYDLDPDAGPAEPTGEDRYDAWRAWHESQADLFDRSEFVVVDFTPVPVETIDPSPYL